MRMCPMATKPYKGNAISPFVAYGPLWGLGAETWGPLTDPGTPGSGCGNAPWDKCFPPEKYGFSYTEEDRYVSYLHNAWVHNDPRRMSGDRHLYLWRTASVKGAGNIPLMADGKQFYLTQPWVSSVPPEYEGQQAGEIKKGWADPMKMLCINRHNYAINVVFLDWSVRRVGLRGLWKLKWARNFDINGVYTDASNFNWSTYGTGWLVKATD